MKDNRVTKILGIKYPLLQAPMNWINNAEMVAAVSNAGALGILGPNAGQKYDGSRRLSTQERVSRELKKIKTLTSQPFGLNIVSGPQPNVVAYALKNIDVARQEGVNIFALAGTYNKEIYDAIKAFGGIILHRELTPTPAAAKEAESRSADIIVATGYDEGGMIPSRAVGTFTIVPTIADAVSVPVVAAGGINDIRGVRAAFALGAEGVYVGTRFIAATECPAAAEVKEMVLRGRADELIFVSANQRSLPTAFARGLHAELEAGVDEEVIEEKIQSIGGLKMAMLDGKIADGIISLNTGIDVIHAIKPCAEIVAELMADFG